MQSWALNFSLADFAASLLGFALFALFAFVPGYVAGWWTDLLSFRSRSLTVQLSLSIALSIGITPVLGYLVGRAASLTAVWLVFGAVWLIFLTTVVFHSRPRLQRRNVPIAAAGIVCGFVAIGLLSLIDVQIQGRLYFSVVSFDYTLRTALVSSIARTGIPPANPYFYPGHLLPLRYHYFWLIPCALVKVLGGSLVSAKQAVIAGTLWSGIGLMTMVPLYLRFVHPLGSQGIYRRSLIGVGLLAVTGLDIIPNLLLDAFKIVAPDPEWWNNQVSSWATAVLWVPHHTAGLVAGLTGVLIIWSYEDAATRGRRAACIAVAGLCLATCAGCSIYVGFVMAVALVVWLAVLFAKGWRKEAWAVLAAGAVAAGAAAPLLLDLLGSVGGPGGAEGVFAFRIRDFTLSHFLANPTELRLNLFNAFMLPLNYFMELGAFLAGGVWILRRWFSTPQDFDRYRIGTLVLAGVSVLLCTFLRSAVIAFNDLGARGFLLAQFILLLWMVDVLEPSFPIPSRTFLAVLLAIGVASSAYEVLTLRFYPMAYDVLNIPRYDWLGADHNLGKRTYALRSAYEQLKTILPPGAIVQHNPNGVPGDLPFGLYADRQAVAETPACGVVFGGDPNVCASVLAQLNPIFEGVSGSDAVDRTCAALSIVALLVKDTDPVWNQPGSWLWQRRPTIANSFVRVVPCGPATSGAAKVPSGTAGR